MELIRYLIEWVSNDLGSTLATLFPFLLVGLLGLYLLGLLIGYLRVSQVGLANAGARPVVALPPSPQGPAVRPRGLPYCPYDALSFPAGARFCTSCERDLVVDCATCGATLSAADASCYRCGTPIGSTSTAVLTG